MTEPPLEEGQETPPEDTGDVDEVLDAYLAFECATARTGASADLVLDIEPAPAPVERAPFELRYAGVDVERYLVEQGKPTDLPEFGVGLLTRVGVGEHDFDDQVPAPATVVTGATARWLPEPGTFTEGESWRAFSGDRSLSWLAEPQSSPYLDEEFVYQRGPDTVTRPAMVFDGSAYMRLNTSAWSTDSATMVVVAVLHQNEGSHYGIFESSYPVDYETETRPAPFGLRYTDGDVQVWARGRLLGHRMVDIQNRPVILALSMGANLGRLMVVESTRTTRKFSTSAFAGYELDLYLARTGLAYDEGATAIADVLEVDFFDHNLTFHELEDVCETLDACYGVRA